LKIETPIRITPTWKEFQQIVAAIRSQKYCDTAQDTADLVEFVGLSGAGTAECANLKASALRLVCHHQRSAGPCVRLNAIISPRQSSA
jgi:hypothetical protein